MSKLRLVRLSASQGQHQNRAAYLVQGRLRSDQFAAVGRAFADCREQAEQGRPVVLELRGERCELVCDLFPLCGRLPSVL